MGLPWQVGRGESSVSVQPNRLRIRPQAKVALSLRDRKREADRQSGRLVEVRLNGSRGLLFIALPVAERQGYLEVWLPHRDEGVVAEQDLDEVLSRALNRR